MGNRRHVTHVEGNVGVCLPSISSGSKSVSEDQSGIGRGHSSTCSDMVPKKSLVRLTSTKLSPNTISAWLKKMISLAYKVPEKMKSS